MTGIAAVVLAAGASTRLGHPKQLVEYEGVPLVRHAVIAAREAGADPVIVVLGSEAHRVASALENLDGIHIVLNSRWQTGMASSLARGLEALAESDGALIVLADQPLVDANALRPLLGAFGPDKRIIASAYAGTLGVPIVVGREHFGDLMQLEGDRGAGPWLRTASGVTAIPVSGPILDIDTAEGMALLRKPRVG
jgi:CTP:molybdopterin cytidylyltransferase MocA